MHRFLALSLAVFGAGASVVQADATLVFGLEGEDAKAVDKTVSISRFFARVDSSDEEGRHLLFQAGKFFPLFSVNAAEKTYTRLTPPVKATLGPVKRKKEPSDVSSGGVGGEAGTEKAVGPQSGATSAGDPGAGQAAAEKPSESGEAAAAPEETVPQAERGEPGAEEPGGKAPPPLPKTPQFKPTRKTDEVAGVRCRVVQELIGGEPAVEHCMANKAALGITERETRTLARLFVLARQRGYDWLGAATGDEDFVSVRSRDLERGKTLTLQHKSTEALPRGHLRIPREFREVEPDAAKGDSRP